MGGSFVELDWDAPLIPSSYAEGCADGACIKGMFPASILEAAKLRGIALPGARERYLSFQNIPMPEYVVFLAGAARGFFPDVSLRRGLRKLGHASHHVFVRSILGAVLMSSAEDVLGTIAAAARAYAITSPPSRLAVAEASDRRIVVSLSNVYSFLDSHHVGVFEGFARAGGVRASSRVRMESAFDGEIELTW